MGPDHEPVLPDEVMSSLAVVRDGLYVDATLGLGGHTSLLLAAGAQVVALDRDPESIERARQRLARWELEGRLRVINSDYRDLISVLAGAALSPVDGILADFGVSSYQLLDPERGFSLMNDGPLDMRLDRSRGRTAADIVNTAPPQELVRILRDFGEERAARRIVRAIVRLRGEAPFRTTHALAQAVEAARPRRPHERLHPATLTFQALRIAVNDELTGIDRFVVDAVAALKRGGRLVVISFHSLEDRQVKRTLRTLEKGCLCPPRLVACGCGRSPQVRLLSRRPIRPDEDESARNPRARSARLRAAEKISDEVARDLESAA